MITIGLTRTEAILDWIHRDLGRAVRARALIERYGVDHRTLRRWMATLRATGWVIIDQGRGADRTVAIFRSEAARRRAEAGA